ncbi:MAG: hypothetical protein WBB19_04435, partial [Desulforhopalus sp.]
MGIMQQKKGKTSRSPVDFVSIFFLLMLMLLPAGKELHAMVISDDFSIDTTTDYTVIDGGLGSFTHDSAGQRLQVLTGDNIALLFSKAMPLLSSGTFSFDFLPTQKYPTGGMITIRLLQDQNNYYEIVYSDGYANRLIRKIVNNIAVESQLSATQYLQNNNYNVEISFSPALLRVSAFGVLQSLTLNSSDIQVVGFEIELAQQDAYFDNISYSDSGPPVDTEPPVWNTTTGIVSAQDTGTGGSVRVDFGMATDTVDGANVDYIVYYAPSSSWSSDWSLNNVALATTVPFTISGLTSDVPYTFGVRVADQSGNEDDNANTLTATPTVTTGSGFSDDFSSDTTFNYSVVGGGGSSFSYDSAGQRVRVLTGDNIALQFSRFLPVLSSGTFSFDFLPTRKYPNGGIITL